MRHLSLALATSLVIFGCSGTRPANLGMKDGSLASCPDSPNCVSTKAADGQHGIAPITFTSSAEDAKIRLLAVIRSMKRTRIVTDNGNYVHAEFTSAIFRFVDDVEFIIDGSSHTIEFRSASRLGHSDFGVNRKRMEEIRRRFNAS
jgi:uncharacterized protein (DUF1499 family)